MSQLLTDPILTGDAAPTVRSGVRVATTAPAALVTFVAGAVVDTVVLAVGNRILIKDQASADENGIYEVQAAAHPCGAWRWPPDRSGPASPASCVRG